MYIMYSMSNIDYVCQNMYIQQYSSLYIYNYIYTYFAYFDRHSLTVYVCVCDYIGLKWFKHLTYYGELIWSTCEPLN